VTLLRAWTTLVFTSFRRLLWSVGTLMLLFPLTACVLFVARRGYPQIGDEVVAFNALSNFLIFIYASFMTPLCALAFGAQSLSGDREDRTLVFLLIRPVPRWVILSAKFAAAWPLAIVGACGGLWLLCRLAGPVGSIAFEAYLPAVFYMTTAYAAVFLAFAVLFRHAVIAALLYALFMEMLLGNVPGIVKKLAINYYGRSLMYDAGVDHGLSAPDPQWFEVLSGNAARGTLLGITLVSLIGAWVIFRTREYEEAA
jgi:ABC-type transport system involved in multi-copper enzyme maturation permease subunit